jgi:hypothetical protein
MADDIVPIEPEFDQVEIRDLLIELDGNVTEAAKSMGVDPQRLRAYVNAMPILKRAIEETLEQGVDQAISVLFEGLRDQQSFQNRYYAAKEFLRSSAGKKRGFGPRETAQGQIEVRKDQSGQNTIVLRWLEPPGEGATIIEGGQNVPDQ